MRKVFPPVVGVDEATVGGSLIFNEIGHQYQRQNDQKNPGGPFDHLIILWSVEPARIRLRQQ